MSDKQEYCALTDAGSDDESNSKAGSGAGRDIGELRVWPVGTISHSVESAEGKLDTVKDVSSSAVVLCLTADDTSDLVGDAESWTLAASPWFSDGVRRVERGC